jgi:hypothetical protein
VGEHHQQGDRPPPLRARGSALVVVALRSFVHRSDWQDGL